MGDPQSTALMSVGSQAFGAIGSATGAYYGAVGQKNMYKAEANIADLNAKMSESEAQSALFQGVREQQQVMLNTSNIKASQRVAFAAHGIDASGGGTPIAVLNSTDTMGEIDKNTAAANAVREAWGFRMQGAGYQGQALVDRATAGSISPGSAFMSSLMTGASSVNQSWNRYTMNYGSPFADTGVVGQTSGFNYGTINWNS